MFFKCKKHIIVINQKNIMKKEDLIFSRKAFLNLPGLNSTASIVTHITHNEMNEYSDYQRSNVHLFISDCSRTIEFDIDLRTEYERENAIHKVDTLIKVLSDFKVALEKECEHQRELQEKHKKRRIVELEEEKKDKETKGETFPNYKLRELKSLIKEIEL